MGDDELDRSFSPPCFLFFCSPIYVPVLSLSPSNYTNHQSAMRSLTACVETRRPAAEQAAAAVAAALEEAAAAAVAVAVSMTERKTATSSPTGPRGVAAPAAAAEAALAAVGAAAASLTAATARVAGEFWGRKEREREKKEIASKRRNDSSTFGLLSPPLSCALSKRDFQPLAMHAQRKD